VFGRANIRDISDPLVLGLPRGSPGPDVLGSTGVDLLASSATADAAAPHGLARRIRPSRGGGHSARRRNADHPPCADSPRPRHGVHATR
jgi:hypothetical protein